MARNPTDPEIRRKAVARLSDGASLRETAREFGVPASTLHRWREAVARSDESLERSVKEEQKTEPLHASALLVEKDARIDLLTSQVNLLTTELVLWQEQTKTLNEALSDERDARRRSDVLLQQSLAKQFLPAGDAGSPSQAWDKRLFFAGLAVLVVLCLVLLLKT